jgi:hypothetical protein
MEGVLLVGRIRVVFDLEGVRLEVKFVSFHGVRSAAPLGLVALGAPVAARDPPLAKQAHPRQERQAALVVGDVGVMVHNVGGVPRGLRVWPGGFRGVWRRSNRGDDRRLDLAACHRRRLRWQVGATGAIRDAVGPSSARLVVATSRTIHRVSPRAGRQIRRVLGAGRPGGGRGSGGGLSTTCLGGCLAGAHRDGFLIETFTFHAGSTAPSPPGGRPHPPEPGVLAAPQAPRHAMIPR